MAKAHQQYYADEVYIQKQAREFSPTEELLNLAGGEENVIEEIRVNGVQLIPDQDKAVDITVPLVVDALDSTSTADALSAKQGKVLYDYIQNISVRGRFLSNWNCATGLATTNPEESPYAYRAGDYFIVSNIAAVGGTNYRPSGASYVIGQASTDVETASVGVSDLYIYDGTNWILMSNGGGGSIAVDSSLSTTSTNPVENRVITNELNKKYYGVVSNAAPSNPTLGMIWYDTTSGNFKTYDGSGWVRKLDLGLNKVFDNSTVEIGKWAEEGGVQSSGHHVTIDPNGEVSTYNVTVAGHNEATLGSGTLELLSNTALGGDETLTISHEQIVANDGTNTQIYSFFGNDRIAKLSDIGGGYSAGTGIDITNNVISADTTVLATKSDLDEKQDELIAGSNITIGQVCESDMRGPTPSGFHIPTNTEWTGVRTMFSSLSLSYSTFSTNFHMPVMGIRGNSSGDTESGYTEYWSSVATSNSSEAYAFYLDSGTTAVLTEYRAKGFPIRAFKNSFEVPTSSWTVVTGTLGSAGIFRNQTDGLISITSDGTTGYTMMDKNIGATTVWSNGDAMSQANCGNFFQWGNNYGFAFSGLLTTSSAQIDTTGYGPGNYYSDSTYIVGNSNRSSIDNKNLWGGVTQQDSTCQSVISATDTTYTAGDGISIDVNNEISNTLPGAIVSATAPSNPTEGMVWYDTTNDALKAYNGTSWETEGTKMVVLEYGVSTWQDFLDAYNKNALVYCKVSSGSSGYRMAFMAYTAGTTTPTEVEFQYYRSRSSHSTAANQLDEVYVYKLTNAGVWTTTQRDTAAKAIAGTGIGLSFSSSGMTINNTLPGATVASTQPSSSSEGDLWYDTTNDALKAYDGTNWKEINDVKVFEGPFQAGFLSHAQDVYDWISTGKYAIVQHSGNDPYFNGDVIFSPTQVTTGTITSWDYLFTSITADGLIENNNEHLVMEVVNGEVTQAYHGGSSGNQGNIIISSNSAPTTPFTGSLWYDTTNNLLKRYDGANWNVISSNESLGGPNVRVSSTSVSDMRGPCPLGFHVPLGSEWGSLFTIFSTFNIANTAASRTTYFKLPGAGNLSYSNGNPGSSGEGHYWESGWSGRGSHAMVFWFGGSLDPTTNLNESFSHGNSIRPFKDTPVVPDSSWTVLYDGSSMATGASVYDPGIYHNPTLGLISASQDGEVWITMADKNLGAIVVYNSGDTCTRANSGNFYQWGNNFGFPYLGAKKTSSTLVDTSGYGPGNYYNNDTFVTMAYPGYKWFSPDNSNLWGGTTRSNRSGNVLSEEGQYSSLPILDSTSSPVANIGQMFYDIATDKVIVRTAAGWKTLKFE